MAENLIISKKNKLSQYNTLLPQLENLCRDEKNLIANLSNISAGLKETFGFFWIGFYLVDTPNELVLGPFQGPVACTRIQKGRGVCGTAWLEQKTILVKDVDEFPNHIACSSQSKSEIVVPIFKKDKFVAVLDIDSEKLNHFDKIDDEALNKLCKWIGNYLF